MFFLYSYNCMKNKVSMIGNKVNIVSKFLFIYFSILFCNAGNNSNKVNFKISKQDLLMLEKKDIIFIPQVIIFLK